MYTILLDSSNTQLAVGLAKDDVLLKSINYEAWQKQSEYMIPELQKLLEEYHVQNSDIKDVMVSIGPGSYTGVRISLTIAKVIAFALQIPLYAVSSLQILKHLQNPSICVINARSNRSYVGVYDNEKVILKDQIINNDDLLKYIDNHPEYTICGDTKYLGISGYQANVISEMLSLKKYLTPLENAHLLKPVYLKD